MSYFNKTVASKDMSGYYLLKNGEFAYNKSYSVGYDFGSIKRLDRYPTGALSTLYICFALKRRHDSDFIKAYFDSLKWYREIYMISAEGARNHGLLNVPTEEFFDTKHYLPENTAEQRKIADFLIALDRRIEAQQSLVNNLKKYKRGLSSSLFDEIAKGKCQTILFADAFRLLQNNTFSRDDLSFEDGNVRNIHYGDVLIKYGTSVDIGNSSIPCIKPGRNIEKFSSTSYLQNGDIVFADTAEDYAVGKATEIIGVLAHKVLSGLHTIPCRPYDTFAPMYLGYYFNSHHFRTQIFRMIQGIKVSSISKSEIVKTCILVPSYEEQARIASALNKVDRLIEREEATVLALQKTRRGLLQHLFI